MHDLERRRVRRALWGIGPRAPGSTGAVCALRSPSRDRASNASRPCTEVAGATKTPLELARDVEHYLADLPVTSYREPLPRRLARWARRHRTLAQIATAALVLLLLTAGSAAVLLQRMAGQEYRARQTALLMAARLAASTAALQIAGDEV